MNVTIGVASKSVKMVETKFGPKPTYSIKGTDGQWYKAGFKNPACAEGDTVSFDFTESKYGKDIDMSTFSKGAGEAPAVASPTATATPAARSYGPPAKPFPIPPLHGDRAIIRQNALTNARELFAVHMEINKQKEWDADVISTVIIQLARKFEAYSAGDLDMAEAMEPKGE
jgi:hypothetical protein